MSTKAGVRIRAKVDYWSFVVKHEWPFMLALLGVLLALGEFLPNALALALSALAVGLGLLQMVIDARELRSRWSAFEFEPAAELFPVRDATLPDAYREPVRHVVSGVGTAVSDDAIDRQLRSTPMSAVVDPDPYQLPATLRSTAPQVLGPTVGTGVVFNGHVLGMSDDPTARAAGRPVRLHRARFFDGQCSNELCRFVIRHRTTGEVYDMRRNSLLGPAGQLATLAETGLANIVGISTLAVTADDALVLIEQTTRNAASAALLAPSGSGSLEPRDLDAVDAGWTLQKLVVHGMERELVEETGLTADDILETSVVGYARWLERGAKPEFFGVTRLGVTSAEVLARRVRGAETLYSGAAVVVDIDLARLGRDVRAGHDVASAPSCPPEIRARGSVPLVVGLRAAALAEPDD